MEKEISSDRREEDEEVDIHRKIVKKWTTEEDTALTKMVGEYGTKCWALIATKLDQNRTGKQCRERWHNQLDPSINKDTWTAEEERLLVEAQAQLGNCWAAIAKRIPGRTDNTVKNHWNSAKRRLTRKEKGNQEDKLSRRNRKKTAEQLSADKNDVSKCKSSSYEKPNFQANSGHSFDKKIIKNERSIEDGYSDRLPFTNFLSINTETDSNYLSTEKNSHKTARQSPLDILASASTTESQSSMNSNEKLKFEKKRKKYSFLSSPPINDTKCKPTYPSCERTLPSPRSVRRAVVTTSDALPPNTFEFKSTIVSDTVPAAEAEPLLSFISSINALAAANKFQPLSIEVPAGRDNVNKTIEEKVIGAKTDTDSPGSSSKSPSPTTTSATDAQTSFVHPYSLSGVNDGQDNDDDIVTEKSSCLNIFRHVYNTADL